MSCTGKGLPGLLEVLECAIPHGQDHDAEERVNDRQLHDARGHGVGAIVRLVRKRHEADVRQSAKCRLLIAGDGDNGNAALKLFERKGDVFCLTRMRNREDDVARLELREKGRIHMGITGEVAVEPEIRKAKKGVRCDGRRGGISKEDDSPCGENQVPGLCVLFGGAFIQIGLQGERGAMEDLVDHGFHAVIN